MDAWNVSVLGEGELHVADGTALDVESLHLHNAVGLSGNGIFVVVGAGIVGILCLLGIHALVPGEGVEGHLAFVIADPCQHGTVGIEVEGAVEGEFLFVYPVGLSVDDLVELSVLCHLALAVVEEQLHQEQVAFAYKGHHVSVLAPQRNFLRAVGAEVGQRAALYIIYIILGREAVAIDALCLGLQQNVAFVGAHDIAVNAFYADASLDVVDIKEHTGLLASLE